jgi:hypothetical protein
MKILIISFVIFLAGCSTLVPVKRNFPDVPKALNEDCKELQLMVGNSITDLLRTVVENYRLHYECSNKVEGWQDWYKEQKRIFDNVK